MRTLIYGSIMMIIALGLVLFDDVEVGLPVLNIAVWAIVVMTGVFLFVRLHRQSRRRSRLRSRSARQVTAHHARLEKVDIKPGPRALTQR